jgi:hypothetical protein
LAINPYIPESPFIKALDIMDHVCKTTQSSSQKQKCELWQKNANDALAIKGWIPRYPQYKDLSVLISEMQGKEK